MEKDGRFLINPGSLTGAFCAEHNSPRPSFCVLSITRSRVVIYVYVLKANGEIDVEETFVERNQFPERSGAAVVEAAAAGPRTVAADAGAGGQSGSPGLFDDGEDSAL